MEKNEAKKAKRGSALNFSSTNMIMNPLKNIKSSETYEEEIDLKKKKKLILKVFMKEKGRLDKIHISIDGEYKMTVDEGYWRSLGIGDKAEIDSGTLESLSDMINRRRAFNKAVELISVREHSRKEIIEKLKQRGYEGVAEDTADSLEEKEREEFSRLKVIKTQKSKKTENS